jgi:hypothetical protein
MYAKVNGRSPEAPWPAKPLPISGGVDAPATSTSWKVWGGMNPLASTAPIVAADIFRKVRRSQLRSARSTPSRSS